MFNSLRTKLIFASVLWTTGLLLLIHMLSILMMHVAPVLMRFHGTRPILTGVVLMIGGLAALGSSLRPFRQLRRQLISVRAGADRQLEGSYPAEVQPLVDDLNALLEQREMAVKRAVATAGDLAHGLKTPLALLAQEADRLEADGNQALAESIGQQVRRMSRQVNYHLARARAAASSSAGSARCPLAPCAEGLVRALGKLYARRELRISSEIGGDLDVRVRREDLDEILGNILDNACKWAKSRVALTACRIHASVSVTVDDDGPGLTENLRSVVLGRGVRLDETAPGSGLGLAIVRDLLELYGGSISLEASPLGGLRVRISLPGIE